jgi:hypothetical protein
MTADPHPPPLPGYGRRNPFQRRLFYARVLAGALIGGLAGSALDLRTQGPFQVMPPTRLPNGDVALHFAVFAGLGWLLGVTAGLAFAVWREPRTPWYDGLAALILGILLHPAALLLLGALSLLCRLMGI